MSKCKLCPRNCSVDREEGKIGYCGQTNKIYVARAALHMWEEPCISGKEGSGTVFFCGCSLRCIFCQNHKIALGKHDSIPGSGVNLEKFALMEFPTEKTTEFAFISRIMREKGIEEYLYCAKKYANRAEFDIIGYCEEAYEEEVNKLQQEGIVRFHGFQKDVKSYYKDCDAVVIASYHEGMSNVLLEAAATGKPVLATNIPYCAKISYPSGITWRIFF